MTRLFLILAQAVALTWIPSPTPGTTTNVYRIGGSCPATLDSGEAIATQLSASTYIDTQVQPDGSYCYYVMATLDGVVSAASNSFFAAIPANAPPPPPAPGTPTTLTLATSPGGANMTKVVITVAASGKIKPTGAVNWIIQGSTVYSDTLNGKGQDTEQIPTLLLRFLPVTITYVGNATFASSTATLQ